MRYWEVEPHVHEIYVKFASNVSKNGRSTRLTWSPQGVTTQSWPTWQKFGIACTLSSKYIRSALGQGSNMNNLESANLDWWNKIFLHLEVNKVILVFPVLNNLRCQSPKLRLLTTPSQLDNNSFLNLWITQYHPKSLEHSIKIVIFIILPFHQLYLYHYYIVCSLHRYRLFFCYHRDVYFKNLFMFHLYFVIQYNAQRRRVFLIFCLPPSLIRSGDTQNATYARNKWNGKKLHMYDNHTHIHTHTHLSYLWICSHRQPKYTEKEHITSGLDLIQADNSLVYTVFLVQYFKKKPFSNIFE